MKKRNLVLSVFSLLAIGTIAVGASSGAFRGLGEMLLADGTTTVWRHYPRREATPTEKGIREYWVSCSSHEVTFEQPTSGTIEDMTEYDTSEFTEHDERWIYTASLPAQEVLMTAATKSLDLGAFAGGVISSIKSGEYSFGTDASALDVSPLAEKATHGVKTVEIETTKDGKYYVLFCETTFVTAEIATPAEFKTYITPESNKNKNGYYKLTQDIDILTDVTVWLGNNWYVGEVVRNNYFSGTLDGNNHILTSASNHIGGIFGTLINSTIKNLTINDRWYSGQHNQSILACKVSSTLLENVSFNITGGNYPETPYCKAPIDGTGSCGYLTNNTFQDNTVKNCSFNFKGKNIGSLFGWHSNMSKPTIINSKIYAKSLVNAMHICNTKKETIVVYQPKGCVKDASIEEELTELTYEQVA